MPIDRITFNPQVLAGKACVRGMRISVSLVLKLLAGGMQREQILADYPDLEDEDLRQCLVYAAMLSDESVHPVATAAP